MRLPSYEFFVLSNLSFFLIPERLNDHVSPVVVLYTTVILAPLFSSFLSVSSIRIARNNMPQNVVQKFWNFCVWFLPISSNNIFCLFDGPVISENVL